VEKIQRYFSLALKKQVLMVVMVVIFWSRNDFISLLVVHLFFQKKMAFCVKAYCGFLF